MTSYKCDRTVEGKSRAMELLSVPSDYVAATIHIKL